MLADSAATYSVSKAFAVVVSMLAAKGSMLKHPLAQNQQGTTTLIAVLVGLKTTTFLAALRIRTAVAEHFVKDVVVAAVSETRTMGSIEQSHQYFATGDMCQDR
jgi:hypothetical protein